MSDHFWEKSYPAGVGWDIEVGVKPLYAVFDEAVAAWPRNRMVDFLDKRLTYTDVDDLIDRAAKGFQALGVSPGVQVALFLPNTPHFIVCFFAILKAGGTVVTLSPLDAERTLQHKLTDSEAKLVVTLDLNALYPMMARLVEQTGVERIVVGSLPDFLPFPKNLLFPLARRGDIAAVPRDERHVRFADLIANDGRFDVAPVDDPRERVAVIQYTGGTTGLPKGAMLTHYNLVAATQQLRQWCSSGDPPLLEDGRERVMGVLPLFHIYALSVVMLLGIAGGYELILHPRFDLDAVMKDLGAKKPTMFPGVPTMYTAILNHPKAQETDLTSLKFCNSGGAPLPVEVQTRFEAATGCKLVEGWGMSETSPTGTGTPMTGKRKPGSCGIPLPGIVIEFVDVVEPSRLIPYGETGELCVRGPNVMKGYWKQPDATAEALAGGRLHSGDIGYMDEEGYVFLVDRKKDMILSGGFNVYPRVIEDAIYQHPSVLEVTVIGIPDEYRGEAAKAFIRLKDGVQPLDFEELKAFLADRLGKHEMPAAMEIRAELPKTVVGKLSKKELVEEEERRRAGAA